MDKEKKYKVLMAGKNKAIIDDLFMCVTDEFTLMTTTMHQEDMNNHLDFFHPDIFLCCLNGDMRDSLKGLVELKRKLTRDGVSFVIVGSAEECDYFQNNAVYLTDLVIEKPVTAEGIRRQLLLHMSQVEKVRAEQAEMQQILEAIKEQERRKHVLVIDDDPGMLKLIKEHLHETYDVATAVSGKIAHKFLETKKTDLILLDYEMPVENGPEVLEKIRENEELAKIPVLFLTGINDKEKIQRAMMLKPQGYLLKPIDKEKLLGTIEKYIG